MTKLALRTHFNPRKFLTFCFKMCYSLHVEDDILEKSLSAVF